MKLEVIVNKKRGVINITSEQFIIEDLKSHVCKKLELSESDFKVKVSCGDSPSIELVKKPSISLPKHLNIINNSFEKPQEVLYYDGRKAFLYCAVAFVPKQNFNDFLAWVPRQVNPFDESGRLKMQGGKDLQYHVENYFIDPTLDNFVDYVHEQKKYDVGSEHHKKWVEV